MTARVGVTLSGRYRLQRLIATGGMGQVWEGLDTRLGRQVAIKVLKAEFSEDSEFVDRFRGEARTVAMLNHSNQAPNVTNASIPEFHPVPVAEQLFQVV